MIVLSVTSTVSRVAGTPCRAAPPPTNPGRSRSLSRRAETLKAIEMSWPRSCQPRRVATACRCPSGESGLIRPLFSASGMNTSGLTTPWRGCSHRLSASTDRTSPGAGADLRLEGQHELLVVDRAVQVAEQRQPLDRVAVDLRAVALDLTAVGLGPVERDVRPLEQRLERVGVLRRHRDADAGLHAQPHAVDDDRLAQPARARSAAIVDARSAPSTLGEQHGELVAAEPGHRDVVAARSPVSRLATSRSTWSPTW